MTNIIMFVLGMFIGGGVGFSVICCCVLGSRSDDGDGQ